MFLTESQIRRYVRRVLSENYQSYSLNSGVPEDPRIPPEDIPIIQTIAKTAVRDTTLEITDDEIHISVFSPRGETAAFLTHHLDDDVWTGSGPSERETEMFGERKIKKEDVFDFAKNFGTHKGFMRSLLRI